jgi:hypothetical protein
MRLEATPMATRGARQTKPPSRVRGKAVERVVGGQYGRIMQPPEVVEGLGSVPQRGPKPQGLRP